MSKEAKIVQSVANALQVTLTSLVDEVDTAGNAVGTDGFTHILVSKNDNLKMYVDYTKLVYAKAWGELESGTFVPKSEYDQLLAEELVKFDKVPEVEVLSEDTLDDYNILVWTSELLKYALAEMAELEEKK